MNKIRAFANKVVSGEMTEAESLELVLLFGLSLLFLGLWLSYGIGSAFTVCGSVFVILVFKKV